VARWCSCWDIFDCQGLSNVRGCADKSLARPGRKQATATKLGIYSTYSPRSSIHFLARCSDLCKPGQFLLGCRCPVSRGIVVQRQDPLGDLPHVQIFMNDGPNPLTCDAQLLSYWFSRNQTVFQDSVLRQREVGRAKDLSASPLILLNRTDLIVFAIRCCLLWCRAWIINFFFYGATTPSGPGPPHYRRFTITLRHTSVGKTPLDEWSAWRRDLYLHKT
jgi:hypothetical protein